jgi:hypothetical protein
VATLSAFEALTYIDNRRVYVNKDIRGENVVIHQGEGDVVGTGAEVHGDVNVRTSAPSAEPHQSRLALVIKLTSVVAAVLILVLGAAGKIPWQYAGPIAAVLVGAPVADEVRRKTST